MKSRIRSRGTIQIKNRHSKNVTNYENVARNTQSNTYSYRNDQFGNRNTVRMITVDKNTENE